MKLKPLKLRNLPKVTLIQTSKDIVGPRDMVTYKESLSNYRFAC